MKNIVCQRRYGLVLSCVVIVLLSCARQDKVQTPEGPVSESDVRIKDVAQLMLPPSVRVWGYGIVGHLTGTGSEVCPEQIEAYLRRTIPKATASYYGVDELIASVNTAVVGIEGSIAGDARRFDSFDLKVTALDNSRTCSLNGGWLYPTDLYPAQTSSERSLPVAASAKGPVFLNKTDDAPVNSDRSGYILGGGRVTTKSNAILRLNEPSFGMASAISNAINQRFGPGTATALSPARVELSIPLPYRRFRGHFYSLMNALYLDQRPIWLRDRAAYWAKQLSQGNEPNDAETALEAIGHAGMAALSGLLHHPDERIRLSAAKCLSGLGVNDALEVLIQIATDPETVYRKEAITALAMSADSPRVKEAVPLLLSDDDFNVAFAAYEKILAQKGQDVSRQMISQSFTLDVIPYGPRSRQVIVAARKDEARIALFGPAVRCKPGYYVYEKTTGIALDTRGNESLLVLTREASDRWIPVGPLRCNLNVSDLIRRLGEEPVQGNPTGRTKISGG